MLKKPWPFLAALPLRGDEPATPPHPANGDHPGPLAASATRPTGLVRHTAMAGCAHPAQPTAAP